MTHDREIRTTLKAMRIRGVDKDLLLLAYELLAAKNNAEAQAGIAEAKIGALESWIRQRISLTHKMMKDEASEALIVEARSFIAAYDTLLQDILQGDPWKVPE